jgi:hypothetical protein
MNLGKEFNQLFIETAEFVAEESFGLFRPYRGYSGRAMYGSQCFGVEIDRDISPAGFGAAMMAKAYEANQRGLFFPTSFLSDLQGAMLRARTDSLGNNVILYFLEINDAAPAVTEEKA